jgi:hypothetical protein
MPAIVAPGHDTAQLADAQNADNSRLYMYRRSDFAEKLLLEGFEYPGRALRSGGYSVACGELDLAVETRFTYLDLPVLNFIGAEE